MSGRHKFNALIFFAALVFLLLTVPANHSEAEDAYFYARMVESGQGAELFHRHHLLYLPLGRCFWIASRYLGLADRALPALIGMSAIAGAATVMLLWGLFPGASWAAVGLLFSYGFWRYSTTAEIYVPAGALSVAAFLSAVRSRQHAAWAGIAIVCAAAALLMHLASGPAVLIGIPVLYACRGRWRAAIAHLICVAVLVVAIYGVVLSGPGAVLYSDDTVPRTQISTVRTWLSALVAAGHTVISGNFVFAFSGLAVRVESAFPYRMLHEEVFMGQHAPVFVRWFAPLTALGAGWGVLGLWGGAVRCAFVRRFKPHRVDVALFVGAVVWLATAALLALLFEPANPEMWILALPALWLCLGCFAPTAAPVASRNRVSPALALVLLLVHNAVGGFALVWRSAGDYGVQKTEWIAKHAGLGDWILTADSHSTVTCLGYLTEALVMDGRFASVEYWRQTLERRPPQNVWILGEFFDPPPAIRKRLADAEQRRRELAELLAPDSVIVHQDALSTVFRWKGTGASTKPTAP